MSNLNYINEYCDTLIKAKRYDIMNESRKIKIDFNKSISSNLLSGKLIKGNDAEYKDNLKQLKDKFNFSKLPKLSFSSVGESVEFEPVDEGIFFGKKNEDKKEKTDPNYPINVGNYNLKMIGKNNNNDPIYNCKQITLQNKPVHLILNKFPLVEDNIHLMDSISKFVDNNFRDMLESVIKNIMSDDEATLSSYKGIKFVVCSFHKNKNSEVEISVAVGIYIEGNKEGCMEYYYNFDTKKQGLNYTKQRNIQ